MLDHHGLAPQLRPDETIVLYTPRAIERPDEVAALLVRAGHAPTMLKVEQEQLEGYFLRLVGVERSSGGTGQQGTAAKQWMEFEKFSREEW